MRVIWWEDGKGGAEAELGGGDATDEDIDSEDIDGENLV